MIHKDLLLYSIFIFMVISEFATERIALFLRYRRYGLHLALHPGNCTLDLVQPWNLG
jgi:hypothetical protein